MIFKELLMAEVSCLFKFLGLTSSGIDGQWTVFNAVFGDVAHTALHDDFHDCITLDFLFEG